MSVATHRILVVEDSDMDAALLMRHLERAPLLRVDVHRAETLAQAQELAQQDEFDVVLLDLHLPDGSGLECLRRMRTAVGDTPIVVVTGLKEPETGVEAVRLGAQDFLSKGDLDGTTVARAISYAVERRAASKALHEAQKRESLGLLAGGVAHDVNNLLSVILGHAAMAASETTALPRVQESLEHLTNAAMRAADLARQMLAYSGRSKFVTRAVDLNELIEAHATLIRAAVPRSIEVETALAEHLPQVMADGAKVQQMVMNILFNAAQAIGDGTGTISIQTEAIEVGAGDKRLHDPVGVALDPGHYASIVITDDGPGMLPEIRKRIFEPFFTTKDTGRGLGLSAVLGVCQSHGGTIRVDSTLGKGASFHIMLPACPSAPSQSDEPASGPTLTPGRTILVIDDEEPVRRVLHAMLDRSGHTALLASGGEEGLEMWRTERARIDAIVLDATMPVLGGAEVLAAIRREDARVPVLMSSGFSSRPTLPIADDPCAAFLLKPFGPDVLFAALAAVIAEARAT